MIFREVMGVASSDNPLVKIEDQFLLTSWGRGSPQALQQLPICGALSAGEGGREEGSSLILRTVTPTRRLVMFLYDFKWIIDRHITHIISVFLVFNHY